MSAAARFDEIAEAQGWDDHSIATILRHFIASEGREASLDAFARDIADEENEGGGLFDDEG